MPKGYWIVRVDVTDPDVYAGYIKANAEPFGRYGAKFLVRGDPAKVLRISSASAINRRTRSDGLFDATSSGAAAAGTRTSLPHPLHRARRPA